MRILHVVPTYLPAVRHGGPIRAVHGLARALADRGNEVGVFTTNLHAGGRLDVALNRAVDLDGVAVSYFAASWPQRLARSRDLARALCRSVERFDVLHLHSLFLCPTRVAARIAERVGTPYVVSPRGMLVRDLVRHRGRTRKSLWIRFVERRTLARASRLVVTSTLEAEEALTFGLDLPEIEVIPNGVDPDVAGGSPSSPEVCAEFVGEGPLFVYLGRLSWKKGLDVLVASIARVPGARLAIAGNDDEGITGWLKERASALGIAGRVAFPGFVDGERKLALFDSARALVLPSLSENFGNVVVEAWSRGVPVVVAPGVGLATDVESVAGGLVARAEPAALASALAQLASFPAVAREMGERGQRCVEKSFSWPAIAESMEATYGRVIAERGRANA